ncbi:MAG TPA: hypothetical protein VF914_01100 [Chloroflexia bacterium]
MIFKKIRLTRVAFLSAGIFALAALLLGAALIQSTNGVSADANPPRQLACPECVFRADHGAYQVGIMPPQANAKSRRYQASVVYDDQTLSGIEAYVAANRNSAKEAFAQGSTVRALITFARPMPFEAFRALMNRPGVTVHEFAIRSIDSTGQRVTTFGMPDREEIAPAEHYSRMAGKDDILQGFISAEVTLDFAAYNSLSASSDVYLIDITDALVRKEVRGRYDEIDVMRFSPYWKLEDLGIVKGK